MIIDELITNHTSSDHYDYRDYNRVGEACAYLQNMLNTQFGFDIHGVVGKHDYAPSDILTESAIEVYMNDVKVIHDAITNPITVPNFAFTVEVANKIEQILLNCNSALENIRKSFIYSNEIYGGEY